MKKVTVLDFVDLENRVSKLGKYIAEELTVDLVSENPTFSVLDRANLNKILREHKLTATGLVDPDNAKKIGMFAGVDAFVLGTIIPKKTTVDLKVRIVTTETAEVAGASKAEFQIDDTVQALLEAIIENSTDPTDQTDPGGTQTDSPGITKTIGDLRVDFSPLRIVNGREYLLTMSLTNRSSKKSVWVALTHSSEGTVLFDPKGEEFQTDMGQATGFRKTDGYYTGSYSFTEIKPKSGLESTMKFDCNHAKATPGQCRLQMELVFGTKAEAKDTSEYNFQSVSVAKLDAK